MKIRGKAQKKKKQGEKTKLIAAQGTELLAISITRMTWWNFRKEINIQ